MGNADDACTETDPGSDCIQRCLAQRSGGGGSTERPEEAARGVDNGSTVAESESACAVMNGSSTC